MNQRLREIVEHNTTTKGRIFDIVIQILIVLSVIVFLFDTSGNLTDSWQSAFIGIEYIFVIVFSIEYILRIYVAERPWKYITSFYGLIDFLAIIPFYLGLPFNLYSLRMFRLLRLFRTLKIVRYNKAFTRFAHAARIIKEEFIIFLVMIGILLFLSGVGIYYFESRVQPEAFRSVFDGLWWGITTLTTTGYGDIVPITVGGKIFTFFILIIGLGLIGIPAGLVASSLGEVRRREALNAEENLVRNN